MKKYLVLFLVIAALVGCEKKEAPKTEAPVATPATAPAATPAAAPADKK